MNESTAQALRTIEAIDSSPALSQAANHYNWSDGFAVPHAIANHPQCDLAVALALFWLADALDSYLEDGPQKPEEWASFCKLLTARLLAGYYKPGTASFPGFSRVEVHKFRQSGVPEVLFSAVEGTGQAA